MLTQAEYDAVMQAIDQSKVRAEIVMNMLISGEQRDMFEAKHAALSGAAEKLPTLGIVEKPKRRYTRRKKEAAA